jgi:hypothetical protein
MEALAQQAKDYGKQKVEGELKPQNRAMPTCLLTCPGPCFFFDDPLGTQGLSLDPVSNALHKSCDTDLLPRSCKHVLQMTPSLPPLPPPPVCRDHQS